MVKCNGNINIYKISSYYDMFNNLYYFYSLADETSHKTEQFSNNSINFIVFSRSHVDLFAAILGLKADSTCKQANN